MALKQDVVDSVLCPKQGMYLRIFCRKLGQVPNPHRLTYTQILVKYPPPPPPLQLGAETDNTILETEKASGRGETLGTIVENNNWARQKKKKNRESFVFTVYESHFAISCFKHAPVFVWGENYDPKNKY